jgi:O-methyltransferase involved in polyketide biosynthesis
MSPAAKLSNEISDVTDTARLVATFRAEESLRTDRLFNDPYARDLAGPGAEKLPDSIPTGRMLGGPIVFRTALMDEILQRLVLGHQIDTVLSLGAGLDARVYRLDLEPTLRWIEVDLPAVLDYKSSVMSKVAPKCLYETHAFDLGDRTRRQEFLRNVTKQGGRTLVMTEGLLYYLPEDSVTGLAEDLRDIGQCDYWLTDVISKKSLWWLQRLWGGSMGDAQMHFSARRGQGTFLSWGYRLLEQYGLITEGLRRGRTFPLLPYPKQGVLDTFNKMILDDLARVVLLRRIGAPELPSPES